MNYLLSTRRFRLLAAVSLALVILPVVEAEPRCPGNTASVTPRLVRPALIVIPVRINQAGPFDFRVDTGSQVTVIDPSLASELNLKAPGRVGLISVANPLEPIGCCRMADSLFPSEYARPCRLHQLLPCRSINKLRNDPELSDLDFASIEIAPGTAQSSVAPTR